MTLPWRSCQPDTDTLRRCDCNAQMNTCHCSDSDCDMEEPQQIVCRCTKPCPFCEAPLQSWRFIGVYHHGNDLDYIEASVVNNPDLTPEHAVYHIPESC